ncbi:MAG TPA: hypothetical protein EYG92_12330 [Lutibacter sp.]|nr:hypothetical protein [Lutibacter sp.]
MNGLQTANAPSSKIVVPHFIVGAISFLVVAILIAYSNTELLSHYFENKLIAITHIAILGWASMMVFGALYQLIPVVYETSLYSEKLASITFWLFLVSVSALSYSFWIGSYTNLLFYSSLLMFSSLLLFIINLHLTYRKTQKPNIQSKFINTAIYWLAATEFVGTLIALNFKYNFLTDSHLHYLKIHAHLGLIGWFLLLIIGAASILIPMFMISHNLNVKKLTYAYYFINIGLVAVSLDWFFIKSNFGVFFYWTLFAIGIGFFLSYVYEAYKTRLRRKLDVGLKYTVISIALLVLPLLLALFLLLSGSTTALVLRMVSVYGISIIFGVISMLIFGQTYKTLPFIIWLDRYQNYVGKYKTPLPRELYSEKIADYQFYGYLVSISLLLMGIVTKQMLVLQIGSVFLILVAMLNFINIMLMVLHKTKVEELPSRD